jgi:hypothetical protein
VNRLKKSTGGWTSFPGRPPHVMRHGKFRHHLAGIAEVRRHWGNEIAAAAEAHTIADLKMEDWTGDRPFLRYVRGYVRSATTARA